METSPSSPAAQMGCRRRGHAVPPAYAAAPGPSPSGSRVVEFAENDGEDVLVGAVPHEDIEVTVVRKEVRRMAAWLRSLEPLECPLLALRQEAVVELARE